MAVLQEGGCLDLYMCLGFVDRIGLKGFWSVRRKGLFVIFYINGMIEGKVQDSDMQKSKGKGRERELYLADKGKPARADERFIGIFSERGFEKGQKGIRERR